MGTQSCQRSGAFRETGRRQMLEHATDWYHAGNFCERMLVYKAGMSKIELLPKKLPFEDPFSVGFGGSDADV